LTFHEKYPGLNSRKPTKKPPKLDTAEAVAQRAKEKIKKQTDTNVAPKLGGIADNSIFADKDGLDSGEGLVTAGAPQDPLSLELRNPDNMAAALNPRPNARARWQRKMVIRDIRHRGQLSKEVRISRSERSHLSKSHFFKTSVKKLNPLARQIAGKSVDEAILQMRFSVKKAAIDVRKHLIQARNEAIVMQGMGLGLPPPNAPQAVNAVRSSSPSSENSPSSDVSLVQELTGDPAITPPLPHQTPIKSIRDGFTPSPTRMYIAQAWVNRGPYGQEPEFRARGRVNMLRPPHTGLTVLLKEERTRTREKAEKEEKKIRQRMGKNMWTQLPDRPIAKPQMQHLLW
jgi:ribosomal protein L22